MQQKEVQSPGDKVPTLQESEAQRTLYQVLLVSFLGKSCVASHIWLLDLSHLCINIRSFQDVLNFLFILLSVSITASYAV